MIRVPAAKAATGDVSMFTLPPGNFPTYITAGADGNLWFSSPVAMSFVSNVGSITPGGLVTLYPVPTPRLLGDTYGITAGPDGNIWFTEIFGGKVGRITPSGSITEFTVGGQPTGITAGPDGRLWFGDIFLNRLRSISTTGVPGAEFSMSGPREVVTGADGNLWITESGANAIARVTPSGSVTRFPLPAGTFGPQGITAGPDGNVWFTTFDSVGRVTPTGTVTLFSPPTEGSWPFDITTGADGNLWFTQRNTGTVGRATPAGEITEFATPAPPGVLGGIAAGPDSAVWFTAQDTGEIGRLEIELDPRELLDELIASVGGLGPGSSLTDKLIAVRAALDAGDIREACEGLTAFTRQVNAQAGKHLTPEQAAELVTEAERIAELLSC
jgi:streptogramin lyase